MVEWVQPTSWRKQTPRALTYNYVEALLNMTVIHVAFVRSVGSITMVDASVTSLRVAADP